MSEFLNTGSAACLAAIYYANALLKLTKSVFSDRAVSELITREMLRDIARERFIPRTFTAGEVKEYIRQRPELIKAVNTLLNERKARNRTKRRNTRPYFPGL